MRGKARKLVETFSLRLDPETARRLALLAQQEERTRSDVLRRLIRQAAREWEAPHE